MGLFTSREERDAEQALKKKEERAFAKNFADFSDRIFGDDSDTDISKIRKELVRSFEDEELIPLTSECWFKAMRDNDGIILTFADNERSGNEKNLYLSKDDSILLFDEIVAVHEGLFDSISLSDEVNGYDYKIMVTINGVLHFDISTNGSRYIKFDGTRDILQKIIFYMLYAKYYKR